MSLTRRELGLMAAAAGVAGATGADAVAPPMPANACDCHVHIIGPMDRYPMDPKRVYTVGPASTADLRALRARTGIARHVLIQPSFYGVDNSCMVDALKDLAGTARGVAVVKPDISDAGLKELDAHGVRGIRLNIETGGGTDAAGPARLIHDFAGRLAPLGWHIQVYASLPVVTGLADAIMASSVPVVIDHFGLAMGAKGTGQPGFDKLVEMVKSRKAYVKLSAPYRISKAAPDYADVQPIARALIDAGADRMLWGSDWPHTVVAPGAGPLDVSPFKVEDDPHNLALLRRWVNDEAVFKQILVDNPARLYRFG